MSIFDAFKEMDEEPSFKKVIDGLYEAVIEDVVIKEDIFETEIRIQYKIATPGPSQGGTISQWIKMKEDDSSNEKKMKFLQWQLRAITGLESLKAESDLLGKVAASREHTIEIEVKTREYNGKSYQGVTAMNFVKGN
jgi:hypothetical protein